MYVYYFKAPIISLLSFYRPVPLHVMICDTDFCFEIPFLLGKNAVNCSGLHWHSRITIIISVPTQAYNVDKLEGSDHVCVCVCVNY